MLGITNAQSNFTTARIAQFVSKQKTFFEADGLDYLQTPVDPACLIYDLMNAIGQNETQIRLVLGDDVFNEIDG